MNVLIRKISIALVTAVYLTFPLIGGNQTLRADDTEVYFFSSSGDDGDSTDRTKVMMLLDVTSQMNGGGGDGGLTRLQMIQEALQRLIYVQAISIDADTGVETPVVDDSGAPVFETDDDGVKVFSSLFDTVDFGLSMFYTNGESSAPILYPVTSLTDTTPDRTFNEAIAEIPGTTPFTGNTTLYHGYAEVARYFLGTNEESLVELAVDADRFTDTTIYSEQSIEILVEQNGNRPPVLETVLANVYGAPTLADNTSCASNAIIVLALGQNNGSGSAENIRNLLDAEGSDDNCTTNGSRACTAAELAKHLFTRPNKSVKTYTVTPGASGNNYDNLLAISASGGTDTPIAFNDEDGAAGLAEQLSAIIEEVSTQGTSFVQAGVTVSQQNRLSHDNFLYFAQFQADGFARWPGNIKKYKIAGGALVDSDGDDAVDATSGLFTTTYDPNDDTKLTGGTSFWSAAADGNSALLGGAASKLNGLGDLAVIPDGTNTNNSYTNRNIFTDNGSASATLQPIDTVLDSTNLDITDGTDIGLTTLVDQDRTTEILKNWIKGFTATTDIDGNITGITDRGAMGDPLHSVPKVLTYQVADEVESLIFFGTNEGYVHAINAGEESPTTDGGDEIWSYLPSAMHGEMKNMLRNDAITSHDQHLYGLDGEITIVHNDLNANSKVDNGEKAVMFIGMRRGGDHYYALDISAYNAPVLLYDLHPGFVVDGETPYSDLGDTWSRPVITNLQYGGSTKLVMIFGGGYDEANDAQGAAKVTSGGNDIFITEALTGKLLWNFQDDVIDSEIGGNVKAKLSSSVVSTVRAVSTRANTPADNIYFTTVDGKVFRLDVNNDLEAESLEITGGIIADINGNTAATNRRFYYAPSISFIPRPNGKSFVAIVVGSGFRAHPLDKTEENHFYMIRDNGVLDGTFPVQSAPITIDDLRDVTVDVDTDAILAAQETADDLDSGWYIKLESSETNNEKVLAEARILFGRIVFTTFNTFTAASGSTCSPSVGSGKLYGVNLLDGTSFFNDENLLDRSIGLVSPGIPPLFQLLYTDGANVDGTIPDYIGFVGSEDINEAFTDALTEGYDGITRINWRKKTND